MAKLPVTRFFHDAQDRLRIIPPKEKRVKSIIGSPKSSDRPTTPRTEYPFSSDTRSGKVTRQLVGFAKKKGKEYIDAQKEKKHQQEEEQKRLRKEMEEADRNVTKSHKELEQKERTSVAKELIEKLKPVGKETQVFEGGGVKFEEPVRITGEGVSIVGRIPETGELVTSLGTRIKDEQTGRKEEQLALSSLSSGSSKPQKERFSQERIRQMLLE